MPASSLHSSLTRIPLQKPSVLWPKTPSNAQHIGLERQGAELGREREKRGGRGEERRERRERGGEERKRERRGDEREERGEPCSLGRDGAAGKCQVTTS